MKLQVYLQMIFISAVGTTKLNGTTAMKLVTSSQSAPNSPVKGVKMACSSVSANSSPTGSVISAAQAAASAAAGAAASGFVKPPPKPQEDPDTLKRIQSILDDYNEQIRNSPDLQNRPAPRRRTNGPTTPTSVSATTTPPPPPMPSAISRKRPSLSSGSPNSSSGSESPLMVNF